MDTTCFLAKSAHCGLKHSIWGKKLFSNIPTTEEIHWSLHLLATQNVYPELMTEKSVYFFVKCDYLFF